MELSALEKSLGEIVEKKYALSQLTYSDTDYDTIEDELHDLEDAFNETYGEYLEDAFQRIYDDLCPDNDVLLPTAYIADQYIALQPDAKGRVGYEVKGVAGVPVEADDFGGKDVRLLLLPYPTRIMVQLEGNMVHEAWRAK
ncbi:hypothetical protein [Penaeicola halotolerans]|uniref:hypothetical protein n=1 Tax=Penaeicola halotolerans TaxID=2793196 RepID=UPI001CF847DB|nr:hypothetical protein [Penaeicola halotolerans]